MKRVKCFGAVACLLLLATSPAHSQSNQVLQGTQLRVSLLTGLSTKVARDGDPFIAVVDEPLFIGGQQTLPAGTRVHGVVARVYRTRRFNLFRGQAAMTLRFKSIEVRGREIPVQMSILGIQQETVQGHQRRKDLATEEGAVVKARRDIKGDLAIVALGTSGGTATGALFSHLVRGLAFGLAGSTAYVMARKGREVELPAQTEFMVRLDTSVTLPQIAAKASPYNSLEQ